MFASVITYCCGVYVLLSVRVRSWRDIAVLVSPLFLIVTYRLLLEFLIDLTSYAWVICNVFYYFLCFLLFATLLGGGSLRVLLSSFRPRKVAGRKGQAVISVIVLFFVFIGVSSFIRNGALIMRYLPQTALFMVVNPFFEELYWRGLLFGWFRGWVAIACGVLIRHVRALPLHSAASINASTTDLPSTDNHSYLRLPMGDTIPPH